MLLVTAIRACQTAMPARMLLDPPALDNFVPRTKLGLLSPCDTPACLLCA